MPDEKKALDWGDIVTRTVVPGLLIALVGFVSERTISSISSKQENARLRIGKTGCHFWLFRVSCGSGKPALQL